jgi:hypothetical protein
MRVAITVSLFTGLTVAHSGVWNIEIDGNGYVHDYIAWSYLANN